MHQSSTLPGTNGGSTKRRAKFLIGGAVVLLGLVGLVVWALTRPESTSFFYTTTEVAALGPSQTSDEYRVNGKVLPDSVDRDGLTTSFEISDGDTPLAVTTEEPLPDAFWTAMANDSSEVDVVARGSYDGSVFTASQVLAKCPSKFKAKADAEKAS
jgi:cytochrome c-type biogenesis protein CcmE